MNLGKDAPMIDSERPNAAQRTGASFMTRVDAADGAGSSPRRLAQSGGTADHRPSETRYLGNPGSRCFGETRFTPAPTLPAGRTPPAAGGRIKRGEGEPAGPFSSTF
jgi:hypothetical protein